MVYTVCQKCGVQLQLSDSVATGSMVRCPSCKQIFYPIISGQPTQANRKKSGKYFGIVIAGLVLLAIGSLASWVLGTKPNNYASTSTAPTINSYPTQPTHHSPRWIRANYRGIVNFGQLTQAGETISATVAEGVKDRFQRGQLQPFLDKFSSLLPQALETAGGGSNNLPRTSVIDELPAESQPAWAALLKGGRIVVTDDGDGAASVFALGNDAKQAYDSSYSVVRHILAALLPSGGQPLKVRVFAYQNDYANCELKLCLDPFELEATNFPTPTGKTPLDLDSLREFFSQGAELAGGSIDSKNNLVLVGKKGAKQTLASEPVGLGDLAVAYRAVFHAGDNQAFISLDPHRNPTMVNVNFGGFLEDTRIGSVVLESDKRFKTITSGLDPTSFIDLRNDIRASVPDFASVGERDLAMPDIGHKGWQGTRFWYYPDSVEIQASLDYRQGAIAKAQFTADAERSRDDFGSSAAFDQAKKSQLSPSIRMNIDDLNRNYSTYASIFPELKELSAVARLMGVCIWLQKANISQLDLDELLSVELPAIQTPREKRQLVSAAKIESEKSQSITLSEAESRAVVRYLTPVLDKTVSDAFPKDEILAEYLAVANGDDEKNFRAYLNQAQLFRQLHGAENVSEIISNKTSLEAFASAASDTIDAPAPPEIAELSAKLDLEKAEVKRLKAKLQEIKTIMNSGSVDVYNEYVDVYNQLVEQVDAAVDRYNYDVDLVNSKSTTALHILEISGGIGLEPDKFKLKLLNSSPELEQTKRAAEMAETTATIQGAEWVRSKPSNSSAPKQKLQLRRSWIAAENHQTASTRLTSASAGDAEHYWRAAASDSGNWHDQTVGSKKATERYYDAASRTLQVAEFEDGKLKDCIVGKYDGQASIVFEKSSRQDIAIPQQPPTWWQ